MKKIYVHAYLVGNLGDDLMVSSVLRRYPKAQFCFVNSGIYRKRFSDLPNCRVYAIEDPDFSLRHRKYMKKYNKNALILGLQGHLIHSSSASVHIGGSVFVQHKDDYSEALEVDRDLLAYSRRLFVVGANFGPYSNPQYLADYRALFPSYTGICMRDHASVELFSDLPNVRYAPDPVFTLRPALPAVKKRKAVFAPIELSFRNGKNDLSPYEDSYARFHAGMIRELLNRRYEVTLLAFCPAEQDETMLQKILGFLPEEDAAAVSCLSYTDDMDAILSEIAQSSLCISTRFHGIVLGLLCGCRTLPIIYSQKASQMLADLNHPAGLDLRHLDAQGAVENQSRRISHADLLDRLLQTEVFDVEPVRRAAEGQFFWLDRYLSGSRQK